MSYEMDAYEEEFEEQIGCPKVSLRGDDIYTEAVYEGRTSKNRPEETYA
jgi:hypothetical protein